MIKIKEAKMKNYLLFLLKILAVFILLFLFVGNYQIQIFDSHGQIIQYIDFVSRWI